MIQLQNVKSPIPQDRTFRRSAIGSFEDLFGRSHHLGSDSERGARKEGIRHPSPFVLGVVDTACRNSYHKGMKTTVSEKGQMTIPKALRVRLGIGPGQTLDVREDRGRLLVTKVESRDPVDQVYGILDLSRPTEQLLAAFRTAFTVLGYVACIGCLRGFASLLG